jgi:hypothetical protein
MTKKKYTKPFVMRTGELIGSPAFRTISLSAHRALCRLEIELCRHGGKDNGRLPVTHQDFQEYGIDHDAIAPAIRELEALGFIEVTQRGTAGKAGQRRPNLFRLTYLLSFGEAPTNEWMAVLTIEDAERIATAARSNVARKRRGFRWENASSRSGKTGISDPVKPDRKIVFLDPGKPDRRSKFPDPENPDVYLEIYPNLVGGTTKGGERGGEGEASPPAAFSTVSSH